MNTDLNVVCQDCKEQTVAAKFCARCGARIGSTGKKKRGFDNGPQKLDHKISQLLS